MKCLLITTAFALLVSASAAQACAPAPSCWIASSPSYLREVCRNVSKASEAELGLDEPEKLPELVAACKRVGVTLKARVKQ